MKFLQHIASWGLTDEMPELIHKNIYLMNWLAILGFFLIIPIQIMFLVLELPINTLFISVMQLLCVFILICNKLRFYHLGHSFLGLFGICVLTMSIITKLNGTTNSLTFVFPPRLAMIFLGLLPIILHNSKYPWIRFLFSLPTFICLVFFEECHAIFGIDIYSFPMGQNTQIFKFSHTTVFVNIAILVVTIQNINKKFESKVKKLYKITEEKNEKLSIQNDIISLKNKQINQSINYAKRIQTAIIPPSKNLQNIIPKSFIFFQPRDTVSGDFYQFYDLQNKVIIGAIDCTGHGVPGAFMSMIGSSILDQLILEKNITSPELILTQMHIMTRSLLKQSETENRDGMDVSLGLLHKKDSGFKLVEFSGAKNPLYFVQNNEMKIIKGDKFSIGGHQRETERNFTKHQIEITTPTMFYIFSDGFQDQFGGEKGRKFLTKNFRKLLHKIHSQPVKAQENILESVLSDWMEIGNENQNDDVLVIGFRVE